MKKYYLMKASIEMRVKNVEICCTAFQDENPEIIEIFKNEEKALSELAKYESDIIRVEGYAYPYYVFSEYFVEEIEEDKNGEFISGGDIIKFSEPKKTVTYWIETGYNYGDKWALHKVTDTIEEEKDEVILWKLYEETPGYSEENDIDDNWRAIDEYIKEDLGFLPDYYVN